MPEGNHKPASHPGLVGKCMIYIDKNDEMVYACIIRTKVTDRLYVAQFFDAFDGLPNDMFLFDIENTVRLLDSGGYSRYLFFEDIDHMDAWLEGAGRRYAK